MRVEPIKSPLGQPDALKHMIDFTLNTLISFLGQGQHPHRKNLRSVSASVADGSLCPCGKNPLLSYFVAGEQALLETLILEQSCQPAGCAESRANSLQELKQAMAHVALREIETFCAVCQLRSQTAATSTAAPAPLSSSTQPSRIV